MPQYNIIAGETRNDKMKLKEEKKWKKEFSSLDIDIHLIIYLTYLSTSLPTILN